MADEIKQTAENEIAALRKQINQLHKALADRGIDFNEIGSEAEGIFNDVNKSARRAAQHAQEEVYAVAETARENPAATSSFALMIGALGFAAGYLLATNRDTQPRRLW